MQELIVQAKQILDKIPFMHIASVSGEGMPRNSPVWVAYDKNYTFFWKSSKDSQHSKNIHTNPNVYVVVTDYDIKRGVYMEGKAYELNDEDEIQEVLEVFYKRKGVSPEPNSSVMNENPRRMYKFIPEKFYINTYEKVDGISKDARIELKLK